MANEIRSVELPNQLTLQYVEQGDPSGIPVLLLHGLTDSWRSFELVLPHLPRSIHVLAVTQRGHGDASRPATGYHSGDFADDLAAFMDALGLEAAVIAGHSSHSLVAERFAIDHPTRTLGLVLISAPATLQDKPGVRELLDSVSKLSDPIDPLFVREFVEGTFSRPVPPWFLEAMMQESLKVPARVWKEAFQGLFEDDLSGELDRIKTPTLLLWGDQDAMIPQRDQEALASAISNARLVVYPGTGHSPHWEEPDRFASDVAAFIRGLVS